MFLDSPFSNFLSLFTKIEKFLLIANVFVYFYLFGR